MEYAGSVSETLKPTFENVTNEFVTSTMYTILCNKAKTNFAMRFSEPEAMDFITDILHESAKGGEYWKRKSEEILKTLGQNTTIDEDTPVMVVRDYREFFERLTELCAENVSQHFKRTGNSSFPWYERTNCMEEIWLRMAPEDFNDPENFLKRQVEMAKDITFNKYDKLTCLGQSKSLGNNFVCIQNKVARTWDEASQEMEITIYDKEHYHNNNLRLKPHYTLPVIRYGIFEKDGKKVCRIYSIQTKDTNQEQNAVHKKVDRARYRVNQGVSQQDTEKVEPKNLMALSIFFNLLNQEGITQIEAQGVYALDYEFHEKRNKRLIKDFKERWTDEKKSEQPDMYLREKSYLDKSYGKEELISEIKTERFVKTFDRLLQHYPMGKVESYPTELDSNYHITIPKIKSKSEINGELLQEMYSLVERQYETIEI
ncbi:MAG: hypothetical protein IJ272_03400 [Clostridia bacterium]|nr:hypothetical protein [Clostridia bacterium]